MFGLGSSNSHRSGRDVFGRTIPNFIEVVVVVEIVDALS